MRKLHLKSSIRPGIVALNAMLILCIVLLFLNYGDDYRQKLRDQNLSSIENINEASANIASSFFLNRQKNLSDMVQYISKRGLSLSETMDYICDSNSDEKSQFELIGTDHKGFAAIRDAGGYPAVSYANSNYSGNLWPVFENSASGGSSGILCTPEFTDAVSRFKSFALYAYVVLKDESGTAASYALLAVSRSQDFEDLISPDSGYDDLTSVLINADGDYLFGSSSFKSSNLFRYFYTFNNLTLDLQNELREEFAASGGNGSFYFRDSRSRDCVFVYAPVPGTQWFCVSGVPLSSYHSTGLDFQFTAVVMLLLGLLMVTDLFWLSGINRKLKESADKEKEASAAKTDFLSRMSHDIRTPLNVIIGSGYLAQKENNPPATRKYLQDIDISGKLLLSLVNDVLDLNKVESGKMELFPVPYSYREFRTEISAVIAPLCAEKGISFSVEGDENGPAYLLDKVRINQIFCNILSNSVKFTPSGGHISMTFAASAPSQGVSRLEFTASDDGRGMSGEFQQHMFDAFTQEHAEKAAAGQGTGLGLAIVRNLVTLMGGEISVTSAPDKGTVFRICLFAPVTAETDEAQSAPEGYASLSGKRILLCEDHPLNAEIAVSMLGNAGMKTERAENGKAGLEMFAASEPLYYDAVLMDVRMPVMNGIEAAKAIRALNRPDAQTVPIIAMTANAYEADVRNCLNAGMNAHTSKPIDPPALFSLLMREIGSAEKLRRR